MLTRHPGNPILTRADIPAVPGLWDEVSAVFNPGAIKLGDEYILLLRVQTRGRETHHMVARSRDGCAFRVAPRPIALQGIEEVPERVYHVYDPRITTIDDQHYILFAMDFDTECRLGLVQTSDFEAFTFIGLTSGTDLRNGVLFPEKIGDRYLRMERPNTYKPPSGAASGSAIVLAISSDLLVWTPVTKLIEGRWRYWDELIGSGPPPVKTRAGWLHVYHGVATHQQSANIYQAGVLLLDLADPSHVLGRSRGNILEPRESYELLGQVPNVVFPSGLIVEDYDAAGYAEPESRVLIYYGAADTVVGLATTTIGDLLAACHR